MADDNNTNGAASPTLSILAQYTKDLSFENPGAPRSLQARDKAPTININVNVNANPLSDTDFDVVLSLNAEAKDGDKTVFHTELAYGGVFRVAGFPQEHMTGSSTFTEATPISTQRSSIRLASSRSTIV